MNCLYNNSRVDDHSNNHAVSSQTLDFLFPLRPTFHEVEVLVLPNSLQCELFHKVNIFIKFKILVLHQFTVLLVKDFTTNVHIYHTSLISPLMNKLHQHAGM